MCSSDLRKYWMYFGVPDLRIATSDNLLDWTPLEDSSGQAIKVLSARPNYFDSWLVEAGPPALLTGRGILVLYNAGSLPSRTYSAGQVLCHGRRNEVLNHPEARKHYFGEGMQMSVGGAA